MKESLKLGITIGVFAVLLLGCLVGLYFQVSYIGYEPFKGKESIAQQMDDLQARLDEAQSRIEQIPEKKKKLKELEIVAKSANQLLPSKRTSDDLLRAIWKKAEESGVVPRSVEPGRATRNSQSEGDYEPLAFTIAIDGPYDNIALFINRMEEFEVAGKNGQLEKRFFAVRKISIKNRSSKLSENGIQTCTMTMETFRYTGEDEED